MKKYLPYILGAVALVALVTLLLASASSRPRRFNERITLKAADKNPYGTYAAYRLLQPAFPKARISHDKQDPGNWDSLLNFRSDQAVFLIGDHFNADEEELLRLINFAKEGNYVFIIARNLSASAGNFLRCADQQSFFIDYNGSEDSLRLTLTGPSFPNGTRFVYPGKKHENYFTSFDTASTLELGKNGEGRTNFIQMNAGKGRLFIHLAPLAFSNYFLLHKNNVEYYKSVLSVIPPGVEKVLWNEYYLSKRNNENDNNKPNWLSKLMQYPSLQGALWTALALLLLYVLLHMRRRQRFIPAYARPGNASLDFIKTIGRLYYEKRDHANLARKMAAYFLEHIRSQYKIPTHTLDEAFVQKVHFKTGYGKEELQGIIAVIENLDQRESMTEGELARFYKQLETFYQNT